MNRIIFKYHASKEELGLSKILLSNLFELAENQSKLVGSLLYGTLSEFTKPGIKYSADAAALICSYLVKKLPKYTKSPQKAVLATKFLFIISNKNTPNHDPHLAFKLAEAILREPWVSKKGGPVSTTNEMMENLPRLILLAACLLVIT